MAILTGGREQARLRQVTWIGRVVVIVLVAGDAYRLGRCQNGLRARVTVGARAWGYGVAADQWETCKGVIEISARPVVGVVTVLAGRG